MTRNLTTADLALASAPGVDGRDANDAAIRETIPRSEAQLRSIIENTTDVIGIVDPEGAILDHSVSRELLERQLEQARRLTGLGRAATEERCGTSCRPRSRFRRRCGLPARSEPIGRGIASAGGDEERSS